MQTKLTVISLNMFGTPFHPDKIIRTFMRNKVRMRFRMIVATLREYNPDVLALQEVHLYPHFFYLRRLLRDYPYVGYQKMWYGPKGGLVIFSKIPLEQQRYIDFYDKGMLFNKTVVGRISHKGIFSSKLHNLPVHILNTHLTQNPEHDWSKDTKFTPLLISQLGQCAAVIQAFVAQGNDIIAVGDFNMAQNSEYYKDFSKLANVKDVFEKSKSPTYHQAFLPEGQIAQRIDYLFYTTKQIKLLAHDELFKLPMEDGPVPFYLTDHIGLLATFSLPQSS